jgi:hypothetical protein
LVPQINLQPCIKILMWPDGQQHDFGGRAFARQQFVSQQGFWAVEFEFVDEHTH